jgi:hypothetical protein
MYESRHCQSLQGVVCVIFLFATGAERASGNAATRGAARCCAALHKRAAAGALYGRVTIFARAYVVFVIF